MHQEVQIPVDGEFIRGDLSVPPGSAAIVIFVHGSGSSRFSPRNRFVAGYLNRNGLATLLFDLLTEREERVDLRTAQYRFNIPFLAERLSLVIDWVKTDERTKDMKIGLFGASTGAAAALIASARRKEEVYAVVSRGGRPDLAFEYLPQVSSPVLLIVGGLDYPVIELNRRAYELLTCEKRLEIVEGASHLFEEEGKLEEVARLATEWFLMWLSK
ncbi:MAG: alpha/beta hydrolase [Aquificota bacterium]|jgi:dienelactone hydrolase|nr:MAG: alpha/beta hydrolase [Aquificota bacterium]